MQLRLRSIAKELGTRAPVPARHTSCALDRLCFAKSSRSLGMLADRIELSVIARK